MTQRDTHDRMANAIRFLSMDAVEKANSGHPGLPMGAADIATVLFTRYLKYDPRDPHWPDRDRFVLSAGHGSMLLYSLLYLTGYEDMTIDEIRAFPPARVAHRRPSRNMATPPASRRRPVRSARASATAIGMALAERILNAQFGDDLVDHRTYVLAGDGCLMEGISQEALALAGHLRLNKLIVFWDNNHISIDGSVSLSDSTDQRTALCRVAAGTRSPSTAMIPRRSPPRSRRRRHSDRPTLIAARTTIGFGAPTKAGTNKAHGSPLGAEEIAATRKALGWHYPPFEVPADILGAWRAGRAALGRRARRVAEAASRPPRPARARRVRAAHERSPARGLRRRHRRLQAEAGRRQAEGRDPQVLGDGARGDQRRGARDDRRLGRPDRLQQHQDQPDQADHARPL